ncbi:conserved hypothetical protein [Paraburkholderia tropica]|nr:conserved hypothetical protein [Paraburkholderia tropica]
MALTFLTGIKGVYFYSSQEQTDSCVLEETPTPPPQTRRLCGLSGHRETVAKMLSPLENQTFTMAYGTKLALFHGIASV